VYCTTKRSIVQLVQVRLHALVVLSILVLAVLGHMPESQAGWITCPPQVVAPGDWRQRERLKCGGAHPGAVCRWYLSRTWHIPILRSLLLWSLWHLSGQGGSAWLSLIPWVQWLWHLGGLLWPWLLHQPEWQTVCWLLGQGQPLMIAALAGLSLGALLRGQSVTFHLPEMGKWGEDPGPWMMGLGCTLCGREEPGIEVVQEGDGSYTATICGHYTLHVAGDHPFRIRMLMLFLRLLDRPPAGWTPHP